MRLFSLSTLGIFGSLLATIPTFVESHGTEVRYCTSPDGLNIRVFIEHWHNDLPVTNPSITGDALFTVQQSGVPGYSAWLFPDAVLNNVLPGNLWIGNCLETSTTLVTECSGQVRNDWVYFDIPVLCDRKIKITLREGRTVYLTEACPTLYPATLSSFRPCPTKEPTRSPTMKPTEFDKACYPSDLNPQFPQTGLLTCADLGGTCETSCDPNDNNCFEEPTLCTLDPTIADRCYCVIPIGVGPPSTCTPTPAPTPRPTIGKFPTFIGISDDKFTKFKSLAGYLPRTDVKPYADKDTIQKELEIIIDDETCDSFDLAQDFLAGDGNYLTTIPTYIGSESDPYNEMNAYYCGDPDPTSNNNFLQKWVKKAYQKRDFKACRGSANFKEAFVGNNPGNPDGDCVGFEEILKKSLAYGGALIESYQLMQKAIDLVETGCSAQNNTEFGGPEPCEDAIEAWDAAAAIYVGSLEGEDGNNDPEGDYGLAPYSLADKRCKNFGTCGANNGEHFSIDEKRKDVTAAINTRILSLFQAGSHAAWYGDYALMKGYLRLISNKSAVPLIQGALRYYYRFSDLEFGTNSFSDSDKELGEGGAFIFPVLPKLWACSTKGEKRAYNEAKIEIKKEGIDFLALQLALECNYQCLGITCAEVGTLYDGGTDPKPGWVTCDDESNGSANVCSKKTGNRKKACKLYIGQPGIKDRNKLKFEF